jgi:hypothetical protein
MSDAAQQIDQAIDSADVLVDGRLNDCPVEPLGHQNGSYYFLSPVGELRILKPSDFNFNGLLSLFEGAPEWLVKHFPGRVRDGEMSDLFKPVSSAAFLMKACSDQGLFDPSTPLRGVGVWRTGKYTPDGDPELVVHQGSTLICSGGLRPAGERIGNAIYPAKPPVAAVADKAASASVGGLLHSTVKRWNWKRPEIDADLFLGFLGQAMLGGAPTWRGHMMVNGQAGSGKSSLAALAGAVLGGSAHPQTNNYTEAGLRQSMTEQARCLILDEAESEGEFGRLQRVVELMRHMSQGDGSKAVRGSTGGQSQSFTLTGCALMLSILRVPLKPQDRSRITQLQIEPIEGQAAPDAWAKTVAEMEALAKMSGAFRRRMVDRWPQYLGNVKLYRQALMTEGISARGSDQMASLLAARDVLLFDDPPSPDEISMTLDLVRPLLDESQEAQAENEGTQMLNHLLSMPTDSHRGGDRMTIGQILIESMTPTNWNKTGDNNRLGAYGMRLVYADDGMGVSELLIANTHSGLNKLFSGTRWANGGWGAALEYLGARPHGKAMRFGGSLSRAQSLPREHWPLDCDEIGKRY